MLPKASPQSPPMFETPWLDRLSRTPPAAVPAIYGPAVIALFLYGVTQAGVTVNTAAVAAIIGLFSWTLAEYWLHRTLFHAALPGRIGAHIHFLIHGVHHRWPRDPYRLVIPLPASIALFWLFLGLFYPLMGLYAWPFHAGFVTGYILYDMSHFYIHHSRPRWQWLKDLRRHHLTHHAPRSKHGGKYGVSTTLWDHVFGTY